jgi:hypothetical protein
VDVRDEGPTSADRREDTVVDVRDDAPASADRREDAAVDRAQEDTALDPAVQQPEGTVDDDQPRRERRVAAHRADPA